MSRIALMSDILFDFQEDAVGGPADLDGRRDGLIFEKLAVFSLGKVQCIAVRRVVTIDIDAAALCAP